jgi:hypothetical protein
MLGLEPVAWIIVSKWIIFLGLIGLIGARIRRNETATLERRRMLGR